MKKVIPFKKDLAFKTRVCEITSISLEHTLEITNNDEITGEFIITGDYKMTEGSINREDFVFKLPFDIVLDSRYDKNNITIDIDDFYYEIINDEMLRVNIDVYVEGDPIIEPEETIPEIIKEDIPDAIIELEKNKLEELVIEEDRKEEGMETEKTSSEDERLEININEEKIDLDINEVNLFDNLDNKETYVTYRVYIMKEEDTVEKIMTKYSISKEELENYNDLENIKIGDKIIIPSIPNE